MPHAPGPWAVDGMQDVVDPKGDTPQGRYSIAVVSPRATKEEQAANLALIAAAPEMLEALDVLQAAEAHYRKSHNAFGEGHIETGRAWDAMRRAGNKACVAVAKATGPAA